MPKRITLVAVGSRGDVQPYIALATGLRGAGYRVRVATHREFGPAIVKRELNFFPLAGQPSRILNTPEGRKWMQTDGRPLRFAYYFVKVMRPILESLLPGVWEACQGSEAIVCSRLGAMALHAAEKLSVPGIMTSVQPLGRTRYFPAVGASVPRWLPGRPIYNWMSHLVVEQIFWQPFRAVVNEWRRDFLGLPRASFRSTYSQVARRGGPLLLAHSESLVPSPPDWPEWIRPTGFWNLKRSVDYRPPDRLAAFLESSSPPVYIGFGSMTFENPREMTELALSALDKSGYRGLLYLPWADLDPITLPQHVMAVSDVPFDWLFPRIAAVVYHGGIGTAVAALRAGLPAITMPFYADQRFWARHVAAAGASEEPLSPRGLTADKLAKAIQRALGNTGIRQRAAAIGSQLEQEDGVGKAVTLIQDIV